MICYVTAFYDIDRSKWKKFKRTAEEYLDFFTPYITLFDKTKCGDDYMIIFMDEKHIDKLNAKIGTKQCNFHIIPINSTFMNQLHCWKTLEIEKENMNSMFFKTLVGDRISFPECYIPEYTLINHCKIDFINYAIENIDQSSSFFAWVDFGFFSKPQNIPKTLLDINKFNKDRINYTLINPITKQDEDIIYTLKHAPEKIGGFFFLGRKDVLKKYQLLYHQILDYYQNIVKICDDDQALVLCCYFKNPNLFAFNNTNFGWHLVFKVNEKIKTKQKVISFCLWGSKNMYKVGLLENIKLAKRFYPSWICYVYLHVYSVDLNFFQKLALFDNVKIIKKYEYKIRPKRFMLWRLEPLLDPNVELFISRDIDTRIQLREVLAVDEWIQSNKTLHIMRDHPQHYNRIMGGMFGLKCNSIVTNIQLEKLIEDFYSEKGEGEDDQNFILQQFYSLDKLIHDEVKKYETNECLSFPIKYEQNGHFVGCYIYEDDSIDLQTTFVLKSYLVHNLPKRMSNYTETLDFKLSFIASKINNIYIMHYSKLTDRKKNLMEQISYRMLDKYIKINWIQHFDRENISFDFIESSYRFDVRVLDRQLTIAEIANAIAHKFILKQILSNDEIALVFEDDCVFKEDFIHHLYYILTKLPSDWEVVCLGGPTTHNEYPAVALPNSIQMNFNSNQIVLFEPSTPAPCTVSSMLYRKSAVAKILNSIFINPRFFCPSDHTLWLCNMEQNVKMLWSQPFISYEGSKSDLFSTTLERGF